VRLSSVALAAGGLFVILAVLLAQRVGVIERVDLSVHGSSRRFAVAHPAWLSVMRAITHLGDTITIVIVDVTVFALCIWRSRLRAALFVAVVGLGTWAVRIVARDVVARPRPADALWPAGGFAFPSGHTTNTAAMMAIIVVVCWPLLHRRGRVALVIAATVYALAVGLSRIVGGVHWPSDVAGGLLLALAVASAATAALTPTHPRPSAPPPSAPPPSAPI
jgi:undecaprenyl-diphosphatase